MKSKTEISSSDKYTGNPRKISAKQSELLKSHIEELGDLSGVIYCHNYKQFVGGNQRSDIFNGDRIEITERYDPPTETKTVAMGFIIHNGEKYAYREVAFSEEEFKKACIVANNDGGEFDWEVLQGWDAEELTDWGMDVADEIEVQQKKKEELKDFQRSHVLISYHPDKHYLIQELIEKLTDHSDIDIETASN